MNSSTKLNKANANRTSKAIAEQPGKAEELHPPKDSNTTVNQRQVIQTKCDDDSAGGDSMNDSFSNIQSENGIKKSPFSLQRKAQ